MLGARQRTSPRSWGTAAASPSPSRTGRDPTCQISSCLRGEEQAPTLSPPPPHCLHRACLGQCFSYSVPNTFPQSTESLVHCDSCMPAQSMWEIVSIPACSSVFSAPVHLEALSFALPPLWGKSFSFPEVALLAVSLGAPSGDSALP